jgi:hypothetical protein
MCIRGISMCPLASLLTRESGSDTWNPPPTHTHCTPQDTRITTKSVCMSVWGWVPLCDSKGLDSRAMLGFGPEHSSVTAVLYWVSEWNIPVPDRKRAVLQSKLHKCCILCRNNMHFIAVAHFIKQTTSEITVMTRYIDVQMCSTPQFSVISPGSVCPTSYSGTDRTCPEPLFRVTRVLTSVCPGRSGRVSEHSPSSLCLEVGCSH